MKQLCTLALLLIFISACSTNPPQEDSLEAELKTIPVHQDYKEPNIKAKKSQKKPVQTIEVSRSNFSDKESYLEAELEYLFHIIELSQSRNDRRDAEKKAKDIIDDIIDDTKRIKETSNSQELARKLRMLALAHVFFEDRDSLEAASKLYLFALDKLNSPSGAFRAEASTDSIYPDQNGRMISALAKLYNASHDTRYLEKAIRAADAIINSNKFAVDDIYLASSFLELYQSSAFPEWLERSLYSLDFIMEKSLRSKVTNNSLEDNLLLARFTNRAYRLSGEKKYQEFTEKVFNYIMSSQAKLLSAVEKEVFLLEYEMKNEPTHIVVIGSRRDKEAKKLHLAALGYPSNYLQVECLDPDLNQLESKKIKYPVLDKAAAFACANQSCSLPIYDSKDLVEKVKATHSN